LRALIGGLDDTLTAAHQGSLLREGLRVALVGPPNAGKSSIFNILSNDEVAIVTPIPGTTRDLIRQTVAIQGLPVHIVDTAGLRLAQDPVEAIGIARAWEAVRSVDVAIFVSDVSQTDPDRDLLDGLVTQLPQGAKVIHARNKIDLQHRPPARLAMAVGDEIWLSAKTGEGVELLKRAIVDAAGWSAAGEGVFMARERHIHALRNCRDRLDAASMLTSQPELAAEELRRAQLALSELTGEMISDDLLGEIFSRFCIGK
jgi:tRNA modification GTPase